jgi:hypothetical protein
MNDAFLVTVAGVQCCAPGGVRFLKFQPELLRHDTPEFYKIGPFPR